MFTGQGGRQIWEVRHIRRFLEVREVRKLGRSGGLEVLRGRKDRQDPLACNECIFATSCRLCKLSFR
jgi:hypothetical protein